MTDPKEKYFLTRCIGRTDGRLDGSDETQYHDTKNEAIAAAVEEANKEGMELTTYVYVVIPIARVKQKTDKVELF